MFSGGFCKHGIQSLSLRNFRNYKTASFEFHCSNVLIYGKNGTGKTSVLEAISYVSFSRGLKNAKVEEVITKGENNCHINAFIYSDLGDLSLESMLEYSQDSQTFKKKIFVDNKQIKKQESLDHYLSCLWLIPQMDNFFLQDNNTRRRFIDKMIFLLDKNHATRISEYEKLIKERNKILCNYSNDKWLELVEKKLSELTVSIVASRIDFLEKLNQKLFQNTKYKLILDFYGLVEQLFKEHNFALKVEELLKESFFHSRKLDLMTGITSVGAHKSKLICTNLENNQEAQRCSTGEQKMFLIHIIIAFVKLMDDCNLKKVTLLLDEINIHLDDENLFYTMKNFLQLGNQLFVTTTHQALFKDIFSTFNLINVEKYN